MTESPTLLFLLTGSSRAILQACLRCVVVTFCAAIIAASGACSRNGTQTAANETPAEALGRMRAAAAAKDFATVYDLCDEKGQSLMMETAFSLFTMELWDRRHSSPKDTQALQRAFESELGLDSAALEAADKNPASRRKTLLLLIEKSKGTMRDTMGGMLQDFARLELASVEMIGEDAARVTFTADNAPRHGYIVRQNGRWVLVSGLSFPGGELPIRP